VSLSCKLFFLSLLIINIINTIRAFVVIAEGATELQATILVIAVMFDVVILSLIAFALGPLHALLFTNSSWSLVCESNLIEIKALIVVLYILVRVVL
jgi:hypothetical protein